MIYIKLHLISNKIAASQETLNEMLLEAIKDNNGETVKYLAQKGADNLNECLFYTSKCINGDYIVKITNVAKYLIKKEANNIQETIDNTYDKYELAKLIK